MLKLYIILTTYLVYISLSEQQNQEEFDNALSNFVNKIPIKTPGKRGIRKLPLSRPNMRTTSETAKSIHNLFEFYTDYTKKRRSLTTPVGFTINSTFCPFTPVVSCNPTSKYPTYDGSCNNLKNPLWGKKDTPYKRWLTPAYADGFNSPRLLAISGKPLPNPRSISIALSPPTSGQKLSFNLTHLFPIFGQFLTHDIAAGSTTTDITGEEIYCDCSSTDSNCMAIKVPINDSYLGQTCVTTQPPSPGPCVTNKITTQTCINFTRSSASFPDTSCSTPSYREQLNLLSSFIDGTAIYGLDQNRANQLRSFTGGLLRTR